MVNAVDLFAGAAVGGAFGPVFDVFREVIEKTVAFNPTLKSVKSTVDSLALLIPQIEHHNQILGGNRQGEVKELKEKMEEGKKLIEELLEMNEWNCLKAHYTDQLVDLDESLKRLLEILQVQGVIDVKEGLALTKGISTDAKEGLALTKVTSTDVKEGLALIKDTSKDAKEGLALTKDTSNDVKESLALTKDISTDAKGGLALLKETLALSEENRNQVVGFDDTLKAGLSDIQKSQEVMLKGLMSKLERNGMANKVGWLGVPEPPSFTVGLDLHLDELKTKLLKDGVSMVLLTGHPGSGKTTLAKSFCQVQEVKDQFKSIFFVNVSKRLNSEVVQEICEKAGTPILCFQSEEIALDRLQQLLKNNGQNPVLLVLDDVWPGNRTSSLLASFKFKESEMSNYKILVTSRSGLKGFDVEYQLESLNDEDAMRLLCNSARLTGSSLIPEDLQRKVVECCKRLPLFIEVVGRSLLGKDRVIWKERVDTWSSGSSVISSEPGLRVCLQSILDALGEENATIKECFVDLASFPQGRRIPAAVLIDVWAADNDSSSIAKLYELTNLRLANLVITRNEMDDYSEHFVTQHDLLRDLAIHQTKEGPTEQRKRLIIDIRGNKFPKWWKKQMDQPFEQARLLSISTDNLFSSKWREIKLPKAKVLVLNFHTKNYALPEFVEKMDKLKVLIVTNHGFLPGEVSNFTLLGSLSKLKTIRLERIWIPSNTKNPIELKRLQKISFFMCNIGQAFSNCSINFFEAFPDLQEMNIDYCSDLVELPADLCILIHLKKLSITNSHKLSALPEEIGNLVNLELLRLRSCTNLSELPGSIRNLKKLNLLDISNCDSIKKLPEDISEMCCLEKLHMRQCSRLQELPESILDLQKLTEVTCDEHTELLWEQLLPRLGNIQIKVVKEEFNLNWLHMFR